MKNLLRGALLCAIIAFSWLAGGWYLWSRVDKDTAFTVPDGYTWKPIIRWGDPLFSSTPAFDIEAQTPEAQAGQFGYNSDYLVGVTLPGRLPVEELCFFVVIPICAVLTFESVLSRRPDWVR